MGKLMTGVFVILGLWVGSEMFVQGPSRAVDGALAGFFSDDDIEATRDDRSTAQRSGDAAARARDATVERRERMLQE